MDLHPRRDYYSWVTSPPLRKVKWYLGDVLVCELIVPYDNAVVISAAWDRMEVEPYTPPTYNGAFSHG